MNEQLCIQGSLLKCHVKGLVDKALCYALFTLYENGTGTSTGNGTGEIGTQLVLVSVSVLDPCEHFYIQECIPVGCVPPAH